MPQKSAQIIRQEFLDFFKNKSHTIVPSASLVPENDQTLLFTNAGMNQFKDIFLGTGSRPYTRATDTQKVMRVSGKHNDFDDVGRDTYHHTFFEMLGNWSFGDYYKKEAITWAWELLTDVWQLPKERLYVTVHHTDRESFELWASETDIDFTHILKFGDKENFWEMGATGPCGPCSEIHIDLTPDLAQSIGAEGVNADDPLFIELWNLVFIQYNRQEDGSLLDLPAKHVDTGMGFERITAVLQQKTSNYDTDLFTPIIDFLSKDSNIAYSSGVEGTPHRVIADHIRALTFAIGDGIIPSNEGRGYVIRKILRRAVRFGKELGYTDAFLYKLVPIVVEIMGDTFPEIRERQFSIESVIRSEEESFFRTLNKGFDKIKEVIHNAKVVHKIQDVLSSSKRFEDFKETIKNSKPLEKIKDIVHNAHSFDDFKEAIKHAKPFERFKDAIHQSKTFEEFIKMIDDFDEASQSSISGDDAFLLYDSLGFPIDFTEQILKDEDLTYDKVKFEALMQAQKERARASWKGEGVNFSAFGNIAKTTYSEQITDAKILGIVVHNNSQTSCQEGDDVAIVLDQTPFYGEKGGQIGDTGTIKNTDDNIIEVFDTKIFEDKYIHLGKVIRGSFSVDQTVKLAVDLNRKKDIARHHSSAHLLFKALRKTLGTHIGQAGSWVGQNRARIDFTHPKALTKDELRQIAALVNQDILSNHTTTIQEMPLNDAKSLGAIAAFEEKYGDIVRVVTMGDSIELCGGTHVTSTGEIGMLTIINESSVSAGTRRIESLVGASALEYVNSVITRDSQVADILRCSSLEIIEKLQKTLDDNKQKDREIKRLNSLLAVDIFKSLQKIDVNGHQVIVAEVSPDQIQDLTALFKSNVESGVLVLGAKKEDAILSVAVTKDLTGTIQAGNLIKELLPMIDGKGGGKPDQAMGGGKNAEALTKTLEKSLDIIKKIL